MKGLLSANVSVLVLSSLIFSGTADAGQGIKQNEGAWYLRLQQAPLIGLAAVSDSGVIDLELMKPVNKYIWIGPTIVAHADESQGSKMRSLNLGVRADLVLPAISALEEGFYISTALLFGTYKSQTVTEGQQWSEADRDYVEIVTCDFKSEGFHRAGAFVVGKQFQMGEDMHLTAGLGVVKSKVMSSNQSGFCKDKSVVKSEGRSLPWIDLGVGFKL